ncbi:MAG: hypothetical protein PUC06_01550 [Oscillospiraceae bacterium]|nr:hypothetical protein [Oscillospiraceae bacterium]
MGKFIRKTALLLLVLLTLAVAAGPVLTPNWNTGDSCFGKTTKAYLAQPEDAISVVTIGSSQVLRGIDTAAMAEDYGIDAYCRATAVQAPAVTYYYTREVIEHHNVKVILADFSFLYDSYDPDEYEPYVRYAFDYMPLSLDKVKAIRNTIGETRQNMLSYLLPVLRYHDRWHDLTAEDFTWPFSSCTDPGKGSILLDDVFTGERNPVSEAPADYVEDCKYWYEKTISLCQEQGVELIMIRLPREGWDEAHAEADAAFAEENGVSYLDFNVPDLFREVGLCEGTDFVDPNHLNRSGAEKLTAWLSDYLLTRYSPEDLS